MAETDYETYALLYTESVRGPGPDSLMATLYSTCPGAAPTARPGAPPVGAAGGALGSGAGAERGSSRQTEAEGFSPLPQAAPRPPEPRSRKSSPPSPGTWASQRKALCSCPRLVSTLI